MCPIKCNYLEVKVNEFEQRHQNEKFDAVFYAPGR